MKLMNYFSLSMFFSFAVLMPLAMCGMDSDTQEEALDSVFGSVHELEKTVGTNISNLRTYLRSDNVSADDLRQYVVLLYNLELDVWNSKNKLPGTDTESIIKDKLRDIQTMSRSVAKKLHALEKTPVDINTLGNLSLVSVPPTPKKGPAPHQQQHGTGRQLVYHATGD